MGAHVNVTDGRYVYMRGPVTPDNTPLYEYTLMPTHLRGLFTVDELQDIQLAEPFSFTKGCRTVKIAARAWSTPVPFETLLFDLATDPKQQHPIRDVAVERMIAHMMRLMEANDAPPEQYERLGLPQPVLRGVSGFSRAGAEHHRRGAEIAEERETKGSSSSPRPLCSAVQVPPPS